ncbi:MAG: hypothetical protein Fur0042_31130 [Cyanophyceae cyanobacterium]
MEELRPLPATGPNARPSVPVAPPTLPSPKLTSGEGGVEEAIAAADALETYTIAVVDDVPQNIDLVRRALRRKEIHGKSLRLLTATTGREAIACIHEQPVDLAILDVMLPDLNGFEVYQALQEQTREGDMAVIFMTALDDLPSKLRGLESGAVDYIVKPFHPKELLARVQIQLRLLDLQRQLQRRNEQLQGEIRDRLETERVLARQNNYLLVLQEIIDEVRSTLEVDDILTTATAKLGAALRADYCAIYTFRTWGMLHLPRVAQYAKTPDLLAQGVSLPPIEHPFMTRLLREDRVLRADPDHWWTGDGASPWGDLLAARSSYRKQPNGAIVVARTASDDPWQSFEQELLVAVASQVGVALAQARLLAAEREQRELLAERNEELQRTEAQLRVANQELERRASIDGLTQLANRRQFDSCFARDWARAQRQGTPIALLMCDVDYFKLYNDCYGHQMGDDCLVAVAEVLGGSLQRGTDLAARYGGEEFIILLPDTDRAGAIALAERIRAGVVARQLPHADSPIADWVTLSVGIAWTVPGGAEQPESLLARADAALYQAKRKGRNTYCVAPEAGATSPGP